MRGIVRVLSAALGRLSARRGAVTLATGALATGPAMATLAAPPVAAATGSRARAVSAVLAAPVRSGAGPALAAGATR
jgi:hypothetical protein